MTVPSYDPEAQRLLGALAEPDRLKVVAALVLGAATYDEIVQRTELPPRQVERAITRLVAAGLVTKGRGAGFRFRFDELHHVVRAAGEHRAELERLGHAPGASEVLVRFVRDGRLITIPGTRAKRLVVLDWLAQEFEPGLRYDESTVNVVLAQFHEDVASLRRYLVDEGFLERDHGLYWRAGGTFKID